MDTVDRAHIVSAIAHGHAASCESKGEVITANTKDEARVIASTLQAVFGGTITEASLNEVIGAFHVGSDEVRYPKVASVVCVACGEQVPALSPHYCVRTGRQSYADGDAA